MPPVFHIGSLLVLSYDFSSWPLCWCLPPIKHLEFIIVIDAIPALEMLPSMCPNLPEPSIVTIEMGQIMLHRTLAWIMVWAEEETPFSLPPLHFHHPYQDSSPHRPSVPSWQPAYIEQTTRCWLCRCSDTIRHTALTQFAWAAIQNITDCGGLTQQNLSSHSLESGKSTVKVLSNQFSDSPERSLPGSEEANFSFWPLMAFPLCMFGCRKKIGAGMCPTLVSLLTRILILNYVRSGPPHDFISP